MPSATLIDGTKKIYAAALNHEVVPKCEQFQQEDLIKPRTLDFSLSAYAEARGIARNGPKNDPIRER